MRSLAGDLERQRARGLYRTRTRLDGPQGVDVTIDGRRCVSYCSNDYLGLAAHPRVVRALRAGAARYGAGSGASHLVSGHGRAHDELEEALAAFTGRERALLFSTGYMANLGVLSALAGRGDRIHADRLCHASLLDGARLSGARLRRYRHCDVEHLAARLDAEDAADGAGGAREARRFIVTDGVFSMDGDLAPLPELAALAARHDAWLVVDDAHGLGVFGADGGGSLAHCGLSATDAPILIGTLGKAFGTFGAFVAGSGELIEALIQFARSYVYTTALPPAIACATLEALRIAREEPWRRERLADLSRRFAEGAVALGLRPQDPGSDGGSDGGSDAGSEGPALPIVPILVGDAQRALALSRALFERGLLVTAIRPPTVPEGGARLRVTLSAAHTPGQVDRLLETLGELS